MRRLHHFLAWAATLLLALCFLTLPGCGGSDKPVWDEFRPRTALPADLQNGSFVFVGFRNGAVFDPSWSDTPATLAFGAGSSAAGTTILPFTLSTDEGASAGTATLAGDTLVLDVAEPAPRHPFEVGEVLVFDIAADVDDGRIRLFNRGTGESQTCAPVVRGGSSDLPR